MCFTYCLQEQKKRQEVYPNTMQRIRGQRLGYKSWRIRKEVP